MSQAQYDVVLHPTVKDTLSNLESANRDRVTDTLQAIAENRQPTNHPKCELMTNAHQDGELYKVKVGDIRCCCAFEKPELQVLKLGRRQSVYSDVDSIYADL